MPLRVGVVGLGAISRFYLAALGELSGLRLSGVCDVRPEALIPFRGRLPCHTDYRELFTGTELDVVLVTLPNDLHADACRTALRCGLDVCVEKPLATTLEDGRELTELASDLSRVLFTAFHRRYNRHVRALRAGLPPGTRVESVEVWYQELIEEHTGGESWYLDPARCGGGCVADNGPNALDVAAIFAGPLSLSGARIRQDESGTDRQAELELSGATGIPARVHLDWAYPGERKEVKVLLSHGEVQHADMLAAFPEFKQSLWHEYLVVLQDFTHAVRTRRRDEAGLVSLSLIDAAYRIGSPR